MKIGPSYQLTFLRTQLYHFQNLPISAPKRQIIMLIYTSYKITYLGGKWVRHFLLSNQFL